MLSEKFKLLIEKLINKTNKREIIWSKTHRDDEYMLKVGNSTILIDCWIDDSFQCTIELAIYNNSGDKIDGIIINEQQVDYPFLLGLHAIAKQTYYNVDETFKSIFEELDSNKIIGEKKKNELDDLI
jgi:hypothetical protein